MPTFNNYWDGKDLAVIKPDLTTKEWQSGLHWHWLEFINGYIILMCPLAAVCDAIATQLGVPRANLGVYSR